MVERIEKTDHLDYWKVQASDQTAKGKNQGEEEENAKDAFENVQDKTDWQLLFNKKGLWKSNIQIMEEEVDRLIFRKLNLKTDPSLLRIDIHLQGGETISPAFVAISRLNALKLKNFNSDDIIPKNLLFQGGLIRVTVPTHPLPPELEAPNNPASSAARPADETDEDATVKQPFRPDPIRQPLNRLEKMVILAIVLLTTVVALGIYMAFF